MTRVSWIPGGDLATWMTLRAMRRLVCEGVADVLTVETAHTIIRACPPRDVRCNALSIRAWLARNFKFVPDPVMQETLRPSRRLLEQFARDGVVSGDCDDAAVLGAALAASVGFIPWAVVAGFRRPGAHFQHVYTVLPMEPYSPGWIDLDVTRPLGVVAPVTRSMGWKLV